MSNHSNKTIKSFNRTRHQRHPYSPTPLNGSEQPMIQNIYDHSTENDNNQSHKSDLYSPLAYDEADEDQLAEFFRTLDIDFSFGGCDHINNMSQVSTDAERHSIKRRRLSNSADSYASSFSEDADDYDGIGLQRKQNR